MMMIPHRLNLAFRRRPMLFVPSLQRLQRFLSPTLQKIVVVVVVDDFHGSLSFGNPTSNKRTLSTMIMMTTSNVWKNNSTRFHPCPSAWIQQPPTYNHNFLFRSRTDKIIPSDDDDDDDNDDENCVDFDDEWDKDAEEEKDNEPDNHHSLAHATGDGGESGVVLRDLRPILEAQYASSKRDGDDFSHIEMDLLKALRKRNPADTRSLVNLRKAYEAMMYWEYAIATQKDILEIIPSTESIDHAHQLVLLGNLHMRNMQILEASTVYQKALMILQQQQQNVSTSSSSKSYPDSAISLAIGKCLVAMAGVQFQRDRIEDAMALLKTAATQYLPRRSQEYVRCLQHQALLHRSRGEYTIALDIYQRAEKILTRELLQYYSRELLRNLRLDIADMHLALEQFEPALTIYQELLRKCRQLDPSDEPQEAVLLHNIGRIHAQQGQYDQALEELEESVILKRRYGQGDTNPEVAKSLDVLGAVHAALGSNYEALQCFKESLLILRANSDDPERDPHIRYAMRNIAVLQGEKVPKWEEDQRGEEKTSNDPPEQPNGKDNHHTPSPQGPSNEQQ